MASDFWQSFLEENPQAAYFSRLNQFGGSPNQRRYFQNQFQDVQNQYMGALGQQIHAGSAPTLNLTDFLAQFFAPQGGAAQQWAGMSPQLRGEGRGRFAPPVRFQPYRKGFGF